MTGMNRLSPWIVRRERSFAGTTALSAPSTSAAVAAGLEDLRLFLTGWAGGLVFFGTLLG